MFLILFYKTGMLFLCCSQSRYGPYSEEYALGICKFCLPQLKQ
jgi:hypothetical protein